MAGQIIMLQDEPRGPSMLIEVNVPTAGQQRVPFPDIAQLRSTTTERIVIKALRLISEEVLTHGIVSGNPTAPATELAKMAITLYSEGWERGQFIPVLSLNDMHFTTGAIPFRTNATYFDNWVNVDWPKSYIQYANTTSSVGTPYVVMFDCQYVKLDMQGKIVNGVSR